MCGLDVSTEVSRHTKQQYVKEGASKHAFDGNLEEELIPSKCCLLEFAAENDLEGFRRHVEESYCKVDVVGSWYVRLNGSRKMVMEWRTPAMIAALYGSLDVLDFIVQRYALFGGELNQKCGHDGSTALHCAVAGGSRFALEATRLLLESGADPTICDAFGRQPCQVIDVPFWLGNVKKGLMNVLKLNSSEVAGGEVIHEFSDESNKYVTLTSADGKSHSLEGGESAEGLASSICSSTVSGSALASLTSLSSSLNSLHANGGKLGSVGAEKVQEYPIDPFFPDIKNGIYATDEFRMYCFKIRPCSRAYSHDWTECPFVHPGENARRRDPSRYHYSCVPCPEFRKGSCRRGDMCEYAHGVFECWLHPAQYRTRFCKDGTSCNRRVCFFAHTDEELRSLYPSAGSSLLSPRLSALVDMSLMSPPLAPDSPLIFSPYSHLQSTHTVHGTPPMSPSSSPSSFTGTRTHQSIPSLYLPGASLQSSRLASPMTARSASGSGSLALSDFEGRTLNDFQSLSTHSLSVQARLTAAVGASCGSPYSNENAGNYKTQGDNTGLNSSEELLASESFLAPKSAGPDISVFSQFEEQLLAQGQVPFSPVSIRTQQVQAQQAGSEPHFSCPTVSSAFSLDSLSRTCLLGGLDAKGQGTKEISMFPMLAAARAAFAQQDRSVSFHDPEANGIHSEWASPVGKLEWGVHSEELFKLRKSSSFCFRNTEESDPSRVQKTVKELLSETHSNSSFCNNGVTDAQRESAELSLLGSWVDKLSLDQSNS